MTKSPKAPKNREKPAKSGNPKPKSELDKELDEGLEESFPASDPPAVTRREEDDPVPPRRR